MEKLKRLYLNSGVKELRKLIDIVGFDGMIVFTKAGIKNVLQTIDVFIRKEKRDAYTN